jgi:hypothetical protein
MKETPQPQTPLQSWIWEGKRLRPPDSEMFDRLGILVNAVTGVPQSLQAVSIREEDYAKTIRSHSIAVRLSTKDERFHFGASNRKTPEPEIVFITPLY